MSTAKGIHDSATGSFGADKNLRHMTNNLRQIASDLVSSSESSSAQLRHGELKDLAQQCEDLADEILGNLDGLMKKERVEARSSLEGAEASVESKRPKGAGTAPLAPPAGS